MQYLPVEAENEEDILSMDQVESDLISLSITVKKGKEGRVEFPFIITDIVA